jgi:hypothetical protein
MPNVNGMNFPYTPEGMAAAERAKMMAKKGKQYKTGGTPKPKYNGGGAPVINHMGMKVPGMTYDAPQMKTGGNPGDKIKKAIATAKNFFSKGKKKTNKNVIDDMDVSKLLFRGRSSSGDKVFKVGASGPVQKESEHAMPVLQNFLRKLKQGEFKPKKK